MWDEIIGLIGIPIVRSVGGWINHALEDKKISRFEWKKLVSTVVRVGLLGTFTYVGFNAAGVDLNALAAGCGAFIADKLFHSLKERKRIN